MKDINVYMYVSDSDNNKYASVYSESSDKDLKYNRAITTDNMDENDVYGYLFGLVGRYIAPFVKMGDKVNFYASQNNVIKAFENSKLKNVGKIEKCEKNLAEITNDGFLDTEFRSLRDFDMARRLTGFGRGFSLFPFHPFDYLDTALELPMRLMFDDRLNMLPISEKKTAEKEPDKATEDPVKPAEKLAEKADMKSGINFWEEMKKRKEAQKATEKTNTEEKTTAPDTSTVDKANDTDWFEKLSTEEKVKVLKGLINKL